MDEFYNFLKEQGIDKSNFKVNKFDIKDIVLLNKDISQKYTQEWIQKREENWEWLEENKKEIPYNYQFDKDKLEIGTHKIFWIQPWTYWFDDCKTCDGHWEIDCHKCWASWEINCWYCKWKWIIIEKKYNTQKIENICNTCNWSWELTATCKKCRGSWTIQTFQNCLTCKWFWKIRTQNNQMQYCQVCQGKGKIAKTIKCNFCVWWVIKWKCNTCWWQWKIYKTNTTLININKPCTNCKQTGRVTCNVCKWDRKITCNTCYWERKTYQYQFNKFIVKVDKKYELLTNKNFNKFVNLIKVIELLPINKVKTITPEEKKLLIENRFKVNEKNISRINWSIYKFQENTTLIDYFLVYNNLNKKFYYLKLPPKNNLEAKFDYYLEKIKTIYNKIHIKYIKPIIDALYNKKNY